MRLLKKIILILCICVLVTACGKKEDRSGLRTFSIYYLDSEMTELVKEDYAVEKDFAAPLVVAKKLLKKMRSSEDANNKSALGENVEVTNMLYKENKLSLYFSAAYNGKNGTEEILSRAAIVQTLCEIEGIDYVEFYVEDQPLMLSGNAVGLMNASSFLSDLEGKGEQTKLLTLYFSNKRGDGLVDAQTPIKYNSAAPIAKLLIESLIQADETIANTNKKDEVIPTLPSSTVLNNLTIRDNVCYLDFSDDINNLLPGIESEVVVYSIVNTLCELPNVNRVQITVEGEQQEKYGEMEGFHLVLERKLDIVK